MIVNKGLRGGRGHLSFNLFKLTWCFHSSTLSATHQQWSIRIHVHPLDCQNGNVFLFLINKKVIIFISYKMKEKLLFWNMSSLKYQNNLYASNNSLKNYKNIFKKSPHIWNYLLLRPLITDVGLMALLEQHRTWLMWVSIVHIIQKPSSWPGEWKKRVSSHSETQRYEKP